MRANPLQGQCLPASRRFLLACMSCTCFSTSLWGATIHEGPLLSDLIADSGTIQSGDTVFSNFAYSRTNDMPSAEAIRVNSIQDTDGNFGIQFQGPFLDRPGGDGSDALITYRVTAPQGKVFSMAHLEANPVALDNGLFSVVETFFPPFDPAIFQLRLQSDTNPRNGVAWETFDRPITQLLVKKNILFEAVESSVTASFFDQTFSQVPEPGSLSLLALTAIFAIVRCRRTAA